MTIKLEHFYRLFWTDTVCQNVFLLHKELLLEKNSVDLGLTDYYLQRIVISNSLTSKVDVDEHLIFRQENKFTSIRKKLAESKEKYLSEERLETFAKKRFNQTIDLVNKEIDKEGVLDTIFKVIEQLQTDEGVIAMLKNYKVIPDSISNMDELGKYAESEILIEIKKFLKKQNYSQMFLSVDGLSQFYHSILKESLINGYKQNIRILIDKENFKSRIKLFDKLYEIKILLGGKFKSYFECINCLPDTFNGFITCNILPSKIKVKCPQCNKDTNYLVPYFIIDELFEHIKHQDGLLFFAIEYLLKAYKIEHIKNVNIEGCNELDFVLKNRNIFSGILEIKMFKNNKTDEVKVKNLMETIYQMKKSKSKLASKNKLFSNIPSFLISNISEKEIINTARTSLRDDLREYNFQIFSPNEFREFVIDKLQK